MIPLAFLPSSRCTPESFSTSSNTLKCQMGSFKKLGFPLQTVELQTGVNVNLSASKVVECEEFFGSPQI